MYFYHPKHLPPLGPPKPTLRQRILMEWRGVDLEPAEKAFANNAKPINALMPSVLAELRMDQRRAEAEILRVWNEILDPNITSHAQPVGLKNGTLFVNVDSSVWLSEIVRYRRGEILDRLQSSFGREFIARISFRIG